VNSNEEIKSTDPSRPFLSVSETAAHFNIGRTMVYELIASGELRHVKIGRRTLIPAGAIAEYSDRLNSLSGAR